MYLSTDFATYSSNIICNLPPNRIRVNLKDRVWCQSDENRVVDREGNPINVSFVILGWSLIHGNIGMRKFEDFINLLFIPVKPVCRFLPEKCVTSTLIAGNSSQEQFYSYWSSLLNNRINPMSIVTQTKFGSKSFNKINPLTGQEGEKISYSYLIFNDREAASDEEKALLKDIASWIKENRDLCLSALESPIAGGNFISLPQGCDAIKLRQDFYDNPLNHHKNLGEANAASASSLPQGIPMTEDQPALTYTSETRSNSGTPF